MTKEQLADQALREIKEIERRPCQSQSEETDRIGEVITRLVKDTLPINKRQNG